jgi:lysophospholipase L1-like esterase
MRLLWRLIPRRAVADKRCAMRQRLPLLAAIAVFTGFASTLHAEILVKPGEKIAFLGDSITQGGWSNPAGYVRLVISGLAANGVNAEAVPAGISGHKSNQMLARLEKDVLEKKPQWMTLSCGVNDVWHGAKGVPLDEAMAASGAYDIKPGEPERGTYKQNITAIIDRARAAGVKPVILTATVIKEDLASPENQKLRPYNAFLRELAAGRNLPLADLNAMFEERIKAENKPGQKTVTSDGVHMNAEGNKLMAVGVLKAFGLDDAQLKKAQEAWSAAPGK